jgi:hypothetical protein
MLYINKTKSYYVGFPSITVSPIVRHSGVKGAHSLGYPLSLQGLSKGLKYEPRLVRQVTLSYTSLPPTFESSKISSALAGLNQLSFLCQHYLTTTLYPSRSGVTVKTIGL